MGNQRQDEERNRRKKGDESCQESEKEKMGTERILAVEREKGKFDTERHVPPNCSLTLRPALCWSMAAEQNGLRFPKGKHKCTGERKCIEIHAYVMWLQLHNI